MDLFSIGGSILLAAYAGWQDSRIRHLKKQNKECGDENKQLQQQNKQLQCIHRAIYEDQKSYEKIFKDYAGSEHRPLYWVPEWIDMHAIEFSSPESKKASQSYIEIEQLYKKYKDKLEYLISQTKDILRSKYHHAGRDVWIKRGTHEDIVKGFKNDAESLITLFLDIMNYGRPEHMQYDPELDPKFKKEDE